MKQIKTVAGVAVLGLALGGYAIVQKYHGSGMDGKTAASMVDHLSEAYGKFAAFDLNKDGQLDAAEKESLAKAIEDGSLALPAHTPPPEAFPSEEQRINHMVEMYARFAVYDGNHDGALDTAEQAALRQAIENGALGFPGGHGSGGMHRLHRLAKSLHPR